MNKSIEMKRANDPNYRLIIGLLSVTAFAIFAVLLSLINSYLNGETAIPASVIYVVDASARMELPAFNQTETRLELAQIALADIIVQTEDTAAGLHIFGAGTPQDGCEDTTSVLPIGIGQNQQIAQQVNNLSPGSNEQAPLARTMIAAIRELSYLPPPHSLVVVTGGEDSCLTNAEALIKSEAELAGIELKLFVVGFDVGSQNADAIKGMIASLGDQALFLDAQNESSFLNALQAIQAVLPADSPDLTFNSPTPIPPSPTQTPTSPPPTNTQTATATRMPPTTINTATALPSSTPLASSTATETATRRPTNTSPRATATRVVSTATRIPSTATRVPATATQISPTATRIPPTNTPIPPTNTRIPPTNTAIPPTNTLIPPTNTAVPPTNTPVPPPTNTPVPPTNTPVPPPTNTPVPPTAIPTATPPPTSTPVPPTPTTAPTDYPGGGGYP